MSAASGSSAPFISVPAQDEYDAIVVGSGVAGGWAAKELCAKGLQVLMLERGYALKHGEYPNEFKQPWEFDFRGRGDRQLYDEEYRIQSQCYAFGEATQHLFVNDKEHPYLSPVEKPYRWIRGYHLGGRSLMWGRQVYRWDDLDFEANAKDGHGVDWPIRYADIAPWYSHVERFVGISGNVEKWPHFPDGEYLPPMEMNCGETFVKENLQRAYPDRLLTIGRSANLTRAHNGRGPCQYRSQCERGCSFGAYFSSLSSTLPAAQATGNLTVVTDAIVHSVVHDPERNRARGVRVIDAKTMEEREYTGRLIFLCASTLGTAQIMLNSTSERFPNGIANSSGALGHYLMDHAFQAGARGEIPGLTDRYYYGRRPNGIYIPKFRNLGGPDSDGLDFLRGYGYQGGASRGGWEEGIGRTGIGAELEELAAGAGPVVNGADGVRGMPPSIREPRLARPGEDRPLGHPAAADQCRLERQRAPGPRRRGGAGCGNAGGGGVRRRGTAQRHGSARVLYPRDGHRPDGPGPEDVGPQRSQPGPRRAQPLRDGWRVHGQLGAPQSVHHLHGADRAGGGVRHRGAEAAEPLSGAAGRQVVHTEHLQNVRAKVVMLGWLIAVAVAALVFLLLAASGVDMEDAAGALAAIVAVAVGFAAGGFVAGFKAMHAPILHGIAMGLASLVIWFLLNLFVAGLFPAEWAGTSPATATGLLLEQIVAAVIGAWAGYASALRGQPEPDEG